MYDCHSCMHTNTFVCVYLCKYCVYIYTRIHSFVYTHTSLIFSKLKCVYRSISVYLIFIRSKCTCAHDWSLKRIETQKHLKILTPTYASSKNPHWFWHSRLCKKKMSLRFALLRTPTVIRTPIPLTRKQNKIPDILPDPDSFAQILFQTVNLFWNYR